MSRVNKVKTKKLLVRLLSLVTKKEKQSKNSKKKQINGYGGFGGTFSKSLPVGYQPGGGWEGWPHRTRRTWRLS